MLCLVSLVFSCASLAMSVKDLDFEFYCSTHFISLNEL